MQNFIVEQLEIMEMESKHKERHQTIRKEQEKMKGREYNQKTTRKQHKDNKDISTYLFIITLYVNRLSSPIKRYSVAELIIKKRLIYLLPKRDLPDI